MAEDLRTPESFEQRLAADEARLTADEARLTRDEARLEAEEAEVQESRAVAWVGVGLAFVLVIAVTALVLGVLALQGDVVAIKRSAPAGSVGTDALQAQAVTLDKLAPGAVTREAVAGEAIGPDELAPGAVTGAHVARNALTGADVRERTLGEVPSARRARSAADAARLGGVPANVYLSRVVDVRATTPTDARRSKGPLTARCPAGTRVISGGAAVVGALRGAALLRNEPDGATGWTATARVARDPMPAWRLSVTAVCARGG